MKQEAAGTREEVPPQTRQDNSSREGIPAIHGGEHVNKYSDLPMDLAKAALVALAEERGERRIFTLEGDFRTYRIHGRSSFEIIPS